MNIVGRLLRIEPDIWSQETRQEHLLELQTWLKLTPIIGISFTNLPNWPSRQTEESYWQKRWSNRQVDYAVAFPAHGQHRTSNELRKQGVFISGSGVRSVWVRHNLENFKKRLKALEEKVARDGTDHWSVKPVMTRPVAKSKRLIRDIWVRRTRFM